MRGFLTVLCTCNPSKMQCKQHEVYWINLLLFEMRVELQAQRVVCYGSFSPVADVWIHTINFCLNNIHICILFYFFQLSGMISSLGKCMKCYNDTCCQSSSGLQCQTCYRSPIQTRFFFLSATINPSSRSFISLLIMEWFFSMMNI